MHSYVNRQLRKLAGIGLYLAVLGPFIVGGYYLGPAPYYLLMALGVVAHLAGARVFRAVAQR